MSASDRLLTDQTATPFLSRRNSGLLAGAVLALALASCAPQIVVPPPPPPPPPPLVVIPPRPTPPDGASPNLVTPLIEADGQRESVNRKVSVNQVVWNLRSAYTVAALGCLNPRNVAILPHYRSFLTRNAQVLKSVYDQMDHAFREKYGRGGETLRDDYLTVLYNHYALPPVKDEFCDVVDQALTEGDEVAPADLGAFAQAKLPVIEKVFDDFYDRYDKYRNALADWEEKYGRVGRVQVGGPITGPIPGPVAGPVSEPVTGPVAGPVGGMADPPPPTPPDGAASATP